MKKIVVEAYAMETPVTVKEFENMTTNAWFKSHRISMEKKTWYDDIFRKYQMDIERNMMSKEFATLVQEVIDMNKPLEAKEAFKQEFMNDCNEVFEALFGEFFK